MPYPKILFTALLVCASFFIVTYTACNKDRCEGVTCQNGGACNDGTCNCPAGYTGTYCETKVDPCKDINCLNGGTCVDGRCKCPDGYTGVYCEIEEDPCIDVICYNGGVCVDGICHCADGYTGPQCQQTFAEGLVAAYACTETCNPPVGSSSWNSTVTLSNTDKTRIVISNFGESGSSVTARVLKDKIILDNTTIGTGQVSGTGTYGLNIITIEYVVTDGSSTFSCNMTMVR